MQGTLTQGRPFKAQELVCRYVSRASNALEDGIAVVRSSHDTIYFGPIFDNQEGRSRRAPSTTRPYRRYLQHTKNSRVAMEGGFG
jgi:hypothetical protein